MLTQRLNPITARVSHARLRDRRIIISKMPSLLSDEEKETVKRQVPKASNKIQAVAIARLYIAYPNRCKWTNTGYQGAVVLANDLIGNTYWLKLVDMSVRLSPILKCLSSRTKIVSSLRIVVYYGIKKYTIHGLTTKIGPFFILLRPRNVWQDCHLLMKKKPKLF